MNIIIEQVLNTNPALAELQPMLRLAWQTMTIGQQLRYLEKPEVNKLLAQCGATFTTDDLIDQMRTTLGQWESELEKRGYQIMQCEYGFFWESLAEASEDFYDREDAVFAAHRHMLNQA